MLSKFIYFISSHGLDNSCISASRTDKGINSRPFDSFKAKIKFSARMWQGANNTLCGMVSP